MNKFKITLIMASFWTLFSCNDKFKQTEFKPQSKQDIKNKTVTQIICDEKSTFNYNDFNDLKNNKYYDRFFAGKLSITSGQIVCVDPLFKELAYPQNWIIEKGEYPVYLYIGLEDDYIGRIAYAELNIKDEIPVYWEISLISEKFLSDDFEKKMNGWYPVETGLSSFSDFETFKKYQEEMTNFYKNDKNANFYNDVLAFQFAKNKNIPKSSRGEDWINYTPKNSKSNMIMFGSGYGDGLYTRYVGYDKNGNVVKFVTDFIKLDETEMR
ncbi:DUF4241 domain-containing protein [Flavobacterium mesophilum]|uniref:DUF4241 domain-containing protein n=1 Tax=Flavobacterium mesophilum TaxID=3143495 RepID=UPI0031D91E85